MKNEEKILAILETLVNKVELLEIGQAGLTQSVSGLEHRMISIEDRMVGLEQQQNKFREEVIENVSYLGEIVGKQLDETQKETKQNSIDIKLIKQKIDMADAI